MHEFRGSVPPSHVDAQHNLAEFCCACRQELTSFATDLCFDSAVWDLTPHFHTPATGHVVVTFARLTHVGGPFRNRSRTLAHLRAHPEECLALGFMPLAKSLVRYLHLMKPTIAIGERMNALRCLDAALREDGISPAEIDPTHLQCAHFDRAMALAINRFPTPRIHHRIGCELKRVVDTLNEIGLVLVPMYGPAPHL
jgi:hypothetical protein